MARVFGAESLGADGFAVRGPVNAAPSIGCALIETGGNQLGWTSAPVALNADLLAKVSKAGDTMTGNLIVTSDEGMVGQVRLGSAYSKKGVYSDTELNFVSTAGFNWYTGSTKIAGMNNAGTFDALKYQVQGSDALEQSGSTLVVGKGFNGSSFPISFGNAGGGYIKAAFLELGAFPAGPTVGPLNIKADGAGTGFTVALNATEYTRFISGGTYKGLMGNGSVPLVVSSPSVKILSNTDVEIRNQSDSAYANLIADKLAFGSYPSVCSIRQSNGGILFNRADAGDFCHIGYYAAPGITMTGDSFIGWHTLNAGYGLGGGNTLPAKAGFSSPSNGTIAAWGQSGNYAELDARYLKLQDTTAPGFALNLYQTNYNTAVIETTGTSNNINFQASSGSYFFTGSGGSYMSLNRSATQWGFVDYTTGASIVGTTNQVIFESMGLRQHRMQPGRIEVGHPGSNDVHSGRLNVPSSGMLSLEVGNGSGTWQTGFREEYNAGGVRHGFFGVTPVARQSIAAAATDAATTQTLANSLRTAIINLGLGV